VSLALAAFMGGLAVCLFAFPLNAVVMRRTKVLQEQLMKQKDTRMALIAEAMNAIRAIKLHAWEGEFEARIAALRAKEVQTLLSFQKLNAITSTMWLTTPTTAALASFLIKSRVLPPYRISASEGFTALTLFQLLSVSLTFLPYVINTAIQANVGLRRISRFLQTDDVDGRDDGAGLQLERGALLVRAASFRWKAPPPAEDDDAKRKPKARGWRRSRAQTADGPTTSSTSSTAPLLAPPPPAATPASAPATSSGAPAAVAPPEHTLTDITLSILPNSLTLICGPTGAGKSSLLAALLGDCPRLAGRAAINGRVSYCPQRAWLANATLRDNITFGGALSAPNEHVRRGW
jgi:ABC-type multidrug transport system fused ATPase/permease subunit